MVAALVSLIFQILFPANRRFLQPYNPERQQSAPAAKNALRKALCAPVVSGTASFQHSPNSPPRVPSPSAFSISRPVRSGSVVYFPMSFLLSFVVWGLKVYQERRFFIAAESPFHQQGENGNRTISPKNKGGINIPPVQLPHLGLVSTGLQLTVP